jgi:hypothetical protein
MKEELGRNMFHQSSCRMQNDYLKYNEDIREQLGVIDISITVKDN